MYVEGPHIEPSRLDQLMTPAHTLVSVSVCRSSSLDWKKKTEILSCGLYKGLYRHYTCLKQPRGQSPVIHNILLLSENYSLVHTTMYDKICVKYLTWNEFFSYSHLCLVFAGPVRWTGKKTKIELNPTAKDQTTGCGCPNSQFFRLPVAMFVEKSKNQKKTGLSSCHVLDLTHAHFSLIVGL